MSTHNKVFEYTKGTGKITLSFPCDAGGTVDTGALSATLLARYTACTGGTIEGRTVALRGVYPVPTSVPFFNIAPA